MLVPLFFLSLLWSGVCTGPDIRVSKAHRGRGYNKVRISVVDRGLAPRPDDFFEYNEPFMHSWTKYVLHTAVKDIDPNSGTSSFMIAGENITIKLPKKGARARGFLIADLCYDGTGGFQCMWEKDFKVPETSLKVIKAMVGSDEIDFWGILGDNFYESQQSGGPVAKKFFEQLPASVKAKPFLTIPGNHDFWLAGEPPGQRPEIDQYGYGFMQMFGQDTEYAMKKNSSKHPYDFSVKPAIGSLPVMDNFVFSHQIGDIGFFGYSGAHSRTELQPLLEDWCEWLTSEDTIHVAVVLGHWDQDNLGCKGGMATKEIFADAKEMDGCKDKQLLFFDGHEHCNYQHPEAPNEGFLVGGNGMWGGGDGPGGCTKDAHQQFGFAILDSDPNVGVAGNTSRVDYFEIARSVHGAPRYGGTVETFWPELEKCLDENPDTPYTSCRGNHSVNWRARPEMPNPTPEPTPIPGAPTPEPSPTPSASEGGLSKQVIIIVAAAGGAALVVALVIVICCARKRKRDALNDGLLQSADPGMVSSDGIVG